MMKTIVTFFDCATKACLESDKEHKVTWALIENQCNKELNDLAKMKFENPMQTVEEFRKKFSELQEAIEKRFKTLMK